jgi:hypothetical protein
MKDETLGKRGILGFEEDAADLLGGLNLFESVLGLVRFGCAVLG